LTSSTGAAKAPIAACRTIRAMIENFMLSTEDLDEGFGLGLWLLEFGRFVEDREREIGRNSPLISCLDVTLIPFATMISR